MGGGVQAESDLTEDWIWPEPPKEEQDVAPSANEDETEDATMANNVIKRQWNMNSMVQIEDLTGMTFQDEAAGHTFEISAIDDAGNAVALSGTPAGVFLRPDNTDQALTCSVSNGKVYATLPAGCYDIPGRFGLTIFLTSNSQTAAIYAAVGTVARTSSGTASPGTTQDVVDLINAINAAIAQIPASDTNLKAAMAPTYSTSALYAVGDYAWYNGILYKCTTAITSGETWTSAHWTAANMGGDVSALKSALWNNDAVDLFLQQQHDGTYKENIYLKLTPPSRESHHVYYEQNLKTGVCYIKDYQASQKLLYFYNNVASTGVIEKGKTYYANLLSTNSNVKLSIYGITSGSPDGGRVVSGACNTLHSFEIPVARDGMFIRAEFPANIQYDDCVLLYITDTNQTLNDKIGQIATNTSNIATNTENITKEGYKLQNSLEIGKRTYSSIVGETIKNFADSFPNNYSFGSSIPAEVNSFTKEVFINTTITGSKYHYFYSEESSIPSGMIKDKTYYVKLLSTNDNLKLDVYSIKNGTPGVRISNGAVNTILTFTIPTSADGMFFRAVFPVGTYHDSVYLIVSENMETLADLIDYIPQYWKTYLESKARAISNTEESIGWYGTNFLFITDQHQSTNYGQSPKLMKYIMEHTSTELAFSGGDIINEVNNKQSMLNQMYFWRDAMKAVDGFCVVGNHDFANQTSYPIAAKEIYSIFSRWNDNRMNYMTNHLYGYYDNENRKIRYIVLDSNDGHLTPARDPSQIAWLKERITELDNKWHIIIFIHMAIAGSSASPELNDSGNALDTVFSDEQENISAKIVAVICGHCHFDASVVGESGIRFISTTSDNYSALEAGDTRTQGTTTEQAFDVYSVDFTNKTIAISRVGAGSDRSYSYN